MVARFAATGRRDAGVVLAVGVACAAAVIALGAAASEPLRPQEWTFDPKLTWPWWPGQPTQMLLVLAVALAALGLAAFIRRPRSEIGQALLVGTAANAASVALWATITPGDLVGPSASWVAFVAAGFLSLVLWSSLVHLAYVFPTRDKWGRDAHWLVPLIYLAPPALLAAGAAAIGALQPTTLDWVEMWSRVHASIVCLLLVVVIVGIAVRFRRISPVRRGHVTGIAVS